MTELYGEAVFTTKAQRHEEGVASAKSCRATTTFVPLCLRGFPQSIAARDNAG
jgi:hypothetical protein